MFNIYLTNWIDERLQDNLMVSSEQLIMSIPFSEGEEPCMINPTIKEEMGKAPSLDFTVNPGMKFYNAYQRLKTLIRIEYINPRIQNSNKTIFYGRVVTINTSNLLEIKSIHAEGAYATLADTQHEGIEEDLQVKKTAWQLFTEIISSHNEDVGEEYWKVFSIGTVDSGILDNESKKRDPTSWSDSLSAIDQLINNYGGYMRARYDHTQSDPYKRLKLDWFRKYYRDLGDKRPYFQLAKNIIDLSSSDEISEVFTRVIPIGHKETTTTSRQTSSTTKKQSSYIYLSPKKWVSVTSAIPSQSELDANFQSIDEFVNAEAKYGKIYKTINFQNATDTSKLSSYVRDWIKKNYFGALRSFTVKAVDMVMVNLNDTTDDLILAGDCVDISYPEFDQNGNQRMTPKTRLVCKSAQIVLFNPEQNSYTIGIPNDAIDFEYGEKSKKKKASATAASGDRPTGTNESKPRAITFKSVIGFLAWIYYWAKWSDRDEAIDNYAYTWYRPTDIFDPRSTDSRPYKTFRANGEQLRLLDTLDENGNRQYAPVTFDFVGVPGAVVLGHYQTRGWTLLNTHSHIRDDAAYNNDSRVPRYIKNSNGFHYGIAYSGDTVFTFSWETYQRYIADGQMGIQPAPIFTWPASLVLAHATTSLDDMDLNQMSTPGDSIDADPEDGALILTDPKTGMPNVEIFPESGKASFGYGYHYEWHDADGNVVEEGTPGAIQVKVQDYDKDGNPLWFTTVNTKITYKGIDGEMHDLEGCIVANDIQLPEIDSFKTKLAVIDELIAARATIGNLRAFAALLGDDTQAYDENGNFVGYSGTSLQVNANNIIGVSGIYAKDENGNIKTDENGNLIIKEGGAILVEKDEATLGLWEDGAMKAGMDVTQNDDGTYQAKLAGDYVILGNGINQDTVDAWIKDAQDGNVVFANYFRAKKLKVDDADVDNSLDVTGNVRVGSNAFVTNKFTAGNVTIGIGGTLTFTGQTGTGGNNTTQIGIDDAHNLMNQTVTHIKITGPASNKYTLWYLPASKVDNSGGDPSTAAGWINAGSFSRAASIKPEWSGSGAEGKKGQHLKIIAHPAGDENTELASYSIGFGNNFNQTNDKGLVQLNTGTPEYIEVGDIRSVSIPYTLDLMAGKADNPEELVPSRTLYTNKKTFLLSTIPITTKPTVSFTKTATDKLGPISGKATDVFGNTSSSITFSVSRPIDPFQDQTSSGATHRVMEFKYGSDVVGRYQVDDYWNGGGNSAYASSPVAISDPTSDEKTAAGSALSLNTYYKYDVKYTNAAGVASSAVDTKYFLTPSESHSVSISDQHDTSSKQELQNIYGSTVTLDTAFSSEQLNKNSRFYGFKVKCGTSSKYYYFQTPSATQTIVTVGDWANYRLGWNASRNMITRSGNSILRGKEMQAGATSAPTGYDTYTIASASVSGGGDSKVGYIATKNLGYPGDSKLGFWIDAGDTRRWSLASGYYLHLKHFGSSSGTGVVSWTV